MFAFVDLSVSVSWSVVMGCFYQHIPFNSRPLHTAVINQSLWRALYHLGIAIGENRFITFKTRSGRPSCVCVMFPQEPLDISAITACFSAVTKMEITCNHRQLHFIKQVEAIDCKSIHIDTRSNHREAISSHKRFDYPIEPGHESSGRTDADSHKMC